MKTSKELRSQLRTTANPRAKKVILSQLQIAKERENTEEDTLRFSIRKCRACDLNKTRSNAVPWSGPTRGRAELLLVGEAPGEREDTKGIPFVGQSGKILDHGLTQAGTRREKCFVMNNLCCRPPGNRDPRPDELVACRPNFEAQLDLGDCPVGVTLGAYALANVIGKSRGSISIGEMRGKPIWVDGRIWVPTFHPAYILRNRGAFPEFVGDLQLALALRFMEDKPLPVPAWDQVEVDGMAMTKLGPALEKKGYAFLYSATLGTQIVITKQEGIRIPPSLRHLPHYTLDELVRVGLMGRGREWTKTALRNLHMVKSEFEGMVVQG